jgi:hypothetical protein
MSGPERHIGQWLPGKWAGCVAALIERLGAELNFDNPAPEIEKAA